MIEFSKIAIEGFRSFEKDQIFSFHNKPGLFMIRGVNRQQPELGANGAGKSSIPEALCFVLYGKTSRGLRAKDISNRTELYHTSVCTEFTKNGQRYSLTRTWNPNSLTLDNGKEAKPVEQKHVDDLIGLDYDGFLRAVLFSQFATYFFDLPPANKLMIFTNLLELDKWDSAVTKVRATLKDVESSVIREGARIENFNNNVAILTEENTQLREKHKLFADNKEAHLLDLESILKRQTDELTHLVKEEEGIAETCNDLKVKISKTVNRLDTIQKSSKKEEQIQKEVEKGIAVLQSKAEQTRKLYKDLTAIKGECPLCNQPVDKAHKNKVDKDIQTHFESIRTDLDTSAVQLEAIKGRIYDLFRKGKEVEDEKDVYENAYNGLLNKADRINTKIILAKEAIARTEKDINDLKAKESPYASMLEASDKKLKEVEDQLIKAKERLSALTKEKQACEYWTYKFKDIKFWLVERAINELELYTNNALMELGLNGYKISFAVEKSRADGSTVRSFQTFITPMGEKDPIAWEAWSGGEIQRIRLAGTIGLSDLICAKTGFASNIEFWDEPTAHLSQEGIDDLLNVLTSRAKLRKKEIWMIDHRTIDVGAFDDVVTVVKDRDGSKILQFINKRHTKITGVAVSKAELETEAKT